MVQTEQPGVLTPRAAFDVISVSNGFGGGSVFPPGCPAFVDVFFGGERWVLIFLLKKAEALKPMGSPWQGCPCTPLAAGMALGKLAP